jgi:hypothetical protein
MPIFNGGVVPVRLEGSHSFGYSDSWDVPRVMAQSMDLKDIGTSQGKRLTLGPWRACRLDSGPLRILSNHIMLTWAHEMRQPIPPSNEIHDPILFILLWLVTKSLI